MIYRVIHKRSKRLRASFLTMETANLFIARQANPNAYIVYTHS